MPTQLYKPRHTSPLPPMAVAHLRQALMLAVYLRLMIVSITLSKVLDVLDVLDVVVGGGGSDLPVVGISPARIEVDSAHITTTAIANRFMDVAPFELRKCQRVYIKKNGTLRKDFLQGRLERLNISFAF